jgi:hypothetical protein
MLLPAVCILLLAHPALSLPSQVWLNWGCALCEETSVESFCDACDEFSVSNTLVVTWTNDNSTFAARDAVKFGTASGVYTGISSEDALHLHAYRAPPISMDLPAYSSGLIHRTTLTGLAPATRYYYRIGNDATAWSEEFSVLSHPGVGPDIPVNVLVLADMDYACFDGKICNPQAVRDALIAPGALQSLGINGGGIFVGDLSCVLALPRPRPHPPLVVLLLMPPPSILLMPPPSTPSSSPDMRTGITPIGMGGKISFPLLSHRTFRS